MLCPESGGEIHQVVAQSEHVICVEEQLFVWLIFVGVQEKSSNHQDALQLVPQVFKKKNAQISGESEPSSPTSWGPGIHGIFLPKTLQLCQALAGRQKTSILEAKNTISKNPEDILRLGHDLWIVDV